MRAVTGFLVGIIAALVALSLGVIVIQNSVTTDVTFLGRLYQAPTGWLLLGFTSVGFVVAFLLLIPGRLGSAWRSWALSKQTHRLQDKLVDVQTQYALLEGEIRLLRAERQRRLGPDDTAAASVPPGSMHRSEPANPSLAAAAPRPVAVGVLDRPGPQIAAPAHPSQKATLAERVRVRWVAMRGRIKARVERVRKRFTRKPANAAASKKPGTGAPAR